VRYNTNLPAIRLTFTRVATCQYGRVPGALCVVRAAFRRDLIRRAASIRALTSTAPPNATRNPALGLSSKAYRRGGR
jgi:hypothetical protein